MPRNLVRIRPNERCLIVGKTGSGKTYLAKHLLRAYRRLVVLDSKGTLGSWNLEPFDGNAKRLLESGNEPIRTRVTFDIVRDLDEAWEDLFAYLYEEVRTNFVLYIDEMYGVVNFGYKAPPGLTALYTRGREFGIGVWSATQRPLGIPLIAKSEAEHVFMFRLVMQSDRDHMGEFMGEEVTDRIIPHEHGFYYKRIDWEEPVYIPQYQSSTGEGTNGRTEGSRPMPRVRS